LNAVKVGLLGLGTVGGGTASVLLNNAEEIARRAGREIRIDYAAALDLDAAREVGLGDIRLTRDAFDVVNDPDIDIVVELIGGYSPARELVLQALENGKHVVTANKALIALHGMEIFAKADEKKVMVGYEAGVAGGIPIIKAIREGLAGNRIQWIAGIINGTGNFILTEMRDKGRDFDDVLKEAQALGYAEADPTFDVEGIDAAHKLTILASLAFGMPLQFEATYTEGISKVSQMDVQYAGELGYRIKHLGFTRRTDNGVELRVHPTLIPERRLIANVDGVMNAVLVQGDAVGPTLYYGAGAGDLPTASAVVADIVDVVRYMSVDHENRVPALGFQSDAIQDLPILPMEEVQTGFYLRMKALDQPGVLAEITRILSTQEISIEAFIQKEPAAGETEVNIIMLTHTLLEGQMNKALEEIEALDVITEKVTRIRWESLK
jgi:homoserine dehydrogenase